MHKCNFNTVKLIYFLLSIFQLLIVRHDGQDCVNNILVRKNYEM